MPESSIIIKAEDRYSDSVKRMAAATKPLSKDVEELQKRLTQIGKNKASIQIDAEKARKELQRLKSQFSATGDEADRMNAVMAQANYDNIQRNLRLVTQEARSVERQMTSTAGVVRRSGNSMGSGVASMVSALAAAGAGQMIGQLAQQGADAMVTSAMGSAGGTVFSSALSSAISGAAMGSLIGPQGAAIGAAIGAGVGAVSGGLQVFEKQDDAFKSYVQEAVEGQLSQRDSDIAAGSAIASQREKDLISFSTLFGNRKTAQNYLSGLVDMANTTPFLYDDLTAMSKTLATYGYGAEGILPVLRTIGDAGAALGMATGDMSMVATALGRMKSSDKTTLEYINILNDRGIGAVGMLSDAYGVDQGTMYSMISKGQVKGTEAVDIILRALTEKFNGSMAEQAKTFAGKTSTLQGMEQEMQNAYGEGYNAEREKGLQKQIDWFSGASGEAQEEANKAIGAWQASLENAKERYIRKAVDDTMESTAYQKAKAEGDAAEMGRLIMEAKIVGMNEYNANEGKDEVLASELKLIQEVRADTSLKDEYWKAGYDVGQEFSKGRAEGMMTNRLREYASVDHAPLDESKLSPYVTGGATGSMVRSTPYAASSYLTGGYAFGLSRVPRDNFPALLHEGERVLTAQQARAQDAGGGGRSFSVHIDNITVGAGAGRAEAQEMAETIAEVLYEKVMLSQ